MDLKYMMKKKTMNANEIGNYIIKKYPNCCLAYNSKNHNYYKEELIEECENFFYYEKLNWCGCGDPDTAKRVIRDFLRILYDYKKEDNTNSAYHRKCKNLNERFGVDNVYDNELLLCLAYTLDSADLIEHGSSIGGAWSTDEGDMFLWLLNQNDELDDE